MPRLPLEIIPLIAVALLSDGDLETVAVLAALSQETYRLVAPLLYAKIVLKDNSPLLDGLHCITKAAADTNLASSSSGILDHATESIAADESKRIIGLFKHVKTLEVRTLRFFPDTKICSRLSESFRPFPNIRNLIVSQEFIKALGERKNALAGALIEADAPQSRPRAISRRLLEHSRFFSFLSPGNVFIEGPTEPSDLVHVAKHHDRLEPCISLSIGLALSSLPSLDPCLPPVQLEIRGWRNADFIYGIWDATVKLQRDKDPDQPEDQWWRWQTRLIILPHIPLDDGRTWQLAMRTVANVLARMGNIRIPPLGVLEIRNVSSEALDTQGLSAREEIRMMYLHMKRAIDKGTLFLFYPQVARKMVRMYNDDGIPRIAALTFKEAE